MKAVNTVLMFSILSGIMVLILQNAGIVLQPPQGGPVEIKGAVRVTDVPIVDVRSNYGPLEVSIAEIKPQLGEIDVNVKSVGSSSLGWSGEIPVTIQSIGNRPVGVSASNRFGLKVDGSPSVNPIEWGEISIGQ